MAQAVPVRIRARAFPRTSHRSSAVELSIRNRAVVGSIPTGGSSLHPNPLSHRISGPSPRSVQRDPGSACKRETTPSRGRHLPKPILGVILGTLFGFIDGLTAYFTPESARVLEIATWSGAKGLIVGLIVGIYARKVESVQKGVIFAVCVALVLSFLAALGNYLGEGKGYWLEIMGPGIISGAIIGYLVQKFGGKPRVAATQ